MRAVVYARLSRATATNALNIVDQLQRCREHALRRGWEVVAEVQEVDSAYDRDSMDARVGFGEVLDLVRSRAVDVVLAWRPDRLWRDQIEAALFLRLCRQHGVQLVSTVTEGDRDPADPGDEMVTTIVAAVGRYESAAKSARLRAKARQVAEAGRIHGGGRRFGLNEAGTSLVEPEAAVIREAATRVLEGESIRSIVRDLNERELFTLNGQPWAPSNLRQMLARPRLAGLRTYHGEIVSKAMWPAILDPELFGRLQVVLADPARNKRGGKDGLYLLTGGLAVCGIDGCGAALVARPRGDGHRSYVCATGPGCHGCGKIRRVADPVEAEVLGRLWAAIENGEIPATLRVHADDGAAARVAELEARLADLARDHYVLSLITRSEFLAARGPLQSALHQAQRAVMLPAPKWEPAGTLRGRWEGLDHAQRRAELRYYVREVKVLPAMKGSRVFDPDLVQVRWAK